MKVSATWNGITLSETDRCVIVGGVHYFRVDSVDSRHLEASDHTTECPWKGTATCFDLVVSGSRLPLGAWRYAEPQAGYEHIRGAIAFAPPVRVERVDDDQLSRAHSSVSADGKPGGSTAKNGGTGTNEEILSFISRIPNEVSRRLWIEGADRLAWAGVTHFHGLGRDSPVTSRCNSLVSRVLCHVTDEVHP